MHLSDLLKNWRKIRLRDVIIILIITSLFSLAVVFAIVGVGHLLGRVPWRSLANTLNQYGNLALVILTFTLAGVTAFYAAVTYRMLVQMRESQRAEIKPILWVNVGKPEFVDTEDDGLRKFVVKKIAFANYGKGAAVNINVRYMIPIKWDEQTNRLEYAQGSAREVPTLMEYGSSFDDELNFFTSKYDLVKHRKSFLQIRTLYEDTERNLYRMEQTYNLIVVPLDNRETYYGLALGREELTLVAFQDRKYIGDLGETIFVAELGKPKVIFRRRSLFN